jgi:Tol biopolymer transport system component
VLIAIVAPAASAQADPSRGCLAYPPDGTAVIYCQRMDNGATELFEQDDEGRTHQLTYLGGTIGSVDVSPSGAMLAFEATLASVPDSQVYLIARHGPRARQVLVGNLVIELGKRQVLVGGDIVEIGGERPHRLTDDGSNTNPRFAPDGTKIGFTSDRLGSVLAWSMNVDGSDQRELLLARLP